MKLRKLARRGDLFVMAMVALAVIAASVLAGCGGNHGLGNP